MCCGKLAAPFIFLLFYVVPLLAILIFALISAGGDVAHSECQLLLNGTCRSFLAPCESTAVTRPLPHKSLCGDFQTKKCCVPSDSPFLDAAESATPVVESTYGPQGNLTGFKSQVQGGASPTFTYYDASKKINVSFPFFMSTPTAFIFGKDDETLTRLAEMCGRFANGVVVPPSAAWIVFGGLASSLSGVLLNWIQDRCKRACGKMPSGGGGDEDDGVADAALSEADGDASIPVSQQLATIAKLPVCGGSSRSSSSSCCCCCCCCCCGDDSDDDDGYGASSAAAQLLQSPTAVPFASASSYRWRQVSTGERASRRFFRPSKIVLIKTVIMMVVGLADSIYSAATAEEPVSGDQGGGTISFLSRADAWVVLLMNSSFIKGMEALAVSIALSSYDTMDAVDERILSENLNGSPWVFFYPVKMMLTPLRFCVTPIGPIWAGRKLGKVFNNSKLRFVFFGYAALITIPFITHVLPSFYISWGIPLLFGLWIVTALANILVILLSFLAGKHHGIKFHFFRMAILALGATVISTYATSSMTNMASMWYQDDLASGSGQFLDKLGAVHSKPFALEIPLQDFNMRSNSCYALQIYLKASFKIHAIQTLIRLL